MADVTPLLAAIDFTHAFNIFLPWCTHISTDRVHTAFTQARYQVISNQQMKDPLQPKTYRQVLTGDAVISSPWLPLTDPALSLVVATKPAVACFLVPCAYLTYAHPARLRFLRALQTEGRLMGINNLPNATPGNPHMWILIFSSSEYKHQLVRPEFREISLSCLIG